MFGTAQSLASSTGNPYLQIGIHNNLGHIHRLEGRFEAARGCHESALVIAQSEGAQRKECLSLEFLGETALEQGRLEEALSYLNRAHSLARLICGRGDVLAEILRRRGEVYSAMKQVQAATKDLHRALELCEARGERREGVLVDRALMFLEPNAPDLLRVRAKRILGELESLRDRFEHSRTVCLILATGVFRTSAEEWLSDAVRRARRYYESLGMWSWKARLLEAKRCTNRTDPSASDAVDVLDYSSQAFAAAIDQALIASRGAGPALILGETGVGKEVIAQSIHGWSERCKAKIVPVNCGAIPETLVESELFGHVRGAFTGAETDKRGLVEAAHRGVLFLDEIGDVPVSVQVRLLRFLDSGEYRRVGEATSRRADVRVIAATNKDLAKLAADGMFRTDLLYRLSVFTIRVPALRERREDVTVLADRILHRVSAGTLQWSDEARSSLLEYDWPGNVRELQNACEYATAKASGRPIAMRDDLPPHLLISSRSDRVPSTRSAFERERRELERSQISRALKRTEGNISQAAELLGMGRNRVSRMMREYAIVRSETRPPE